MSVDLFTLCDRQLLLLFTVLGEGRARLVYAKWSRFPFATVKLDGFGSFSLLKSSFGLSGSLLGGLGSLGAFWMLPGCLLGASWVAPGCLLDASWLLPGHVLGGFW